LIHVRYGGRSYDLGEKQVRITPTMSDRAIKQAIARHLEVGESQLDRYFVDRRPSGDVIIRPEAVYG
jgi:hypothetical protein